MPITVHAYRDAESLTPEQEQQIINLYEFSPEFGDGKHALTQLKTAMSRGDSFYTAEFNEKMIAAVWSRGRGDTRTFQYIITHPANRGRGIAEVLITEASKIDTEAGVTNFIPGCGAVHRILSHIGLL